MSSSQPRNVCRVSTCFATVLVILAVFAGLAIPVAAQSRAAEWELFELPESVDLILGYAPGSEQAVSILPAEGVFGILFDSTPFEQVSAGRIDPLAWQTVPDFELWPGETLVLQTTDGTVFKVTLSPPPHLQLTMLLFL
ncbi:MAG: hypothetical protein GY801_20900 [bacterium]|nr:hypothetical protein [bacterium]